VGEGVECETAVREVCENVHLVLSLTIITGGLLEKCNFEYKSTVTNITVQIFEFICDKFNIHEFSPELLILVGVS
jgi:hypothetical protein